LCFSAVFIFHRLSLFFFLLPSFSSFLYSLSPCSRQIKLPRGQLPLLVEQLRSFTVPAVTVLHNSDDVADWMQFHKRVGVSENC
jgi:hypothetical protein